MSATKPNVQVILKRDENIERALRRFKRLCEKANIKKIVRAKRYYEKPSDQKRREIRKSLRNRRRADFKAEQRKQRKLARARRKQRGLVNVAPAAAPTAVAIPAPVAAS
ncbi:30S ribosomal protein S21 [Planctomycetota bacterium]|nr:30S ribosomal protein S21 [Planctomycetota bacterium]